MQLQQRYIIWAFSPWTLVSTLDVNGEYDEGSNTPLALKL